MAERSAMQEARTAARQLRRTITVASIATVAFAAFIGLDPAGATVTRWVSDFGLVAAPLAAAATLFGAARRSAGATGRAWWWVGVSSLLWALGQLVWALQQNVFDHALPIGSFPDVFWVIASAAGIYGAATLATGSPLSKVRVGIDGAVAALALLAVTWVLVLDPALESGILGTIGTMTAVTYKVTDIVEVALLLSILGGSPRRGRTPLIWVTAAGIIHAATNATYTALVVKGSYQTGDVLDVGWFAAFAALIVAGRAAQMEPTTWQGYFRPHPRTLVPYVPVVAGAVAILWASHADVTIAPGVLEIAAVIGLLMVPRQWLAVSEHASSYRRLAEAQQVGGVGSWEQDDRSGRIFWSDEMFRIFGMDPRRGEPSVEELGAVLHPDDRDRALAAIARVGLDGDSFALDCRVYRPDGSLRWVRSTGRVTSGRRPRLHGTCQDVTESKTAELAVRQSQKLEALGRLAGGIAHDFNNLLTPIIAHAELLTAEAGDDHARNATSIAAITTAGRRAASLTQQLLAFCRAQEPTTCSVDVNEVVDEVAALVRASLPDHVTVAIGSTTSSAAVLGDPGQLHQVVLNLALNAVDAMRDGGVVDISTVVEVPSSTAGVVVGAVPKGECVRVTVSDTGVGMDPSTATRCFEPFFTTKPPGKGTGLGLATVYGIVTQNGGAIEVDTATGRGTKISVLLPAAATPVAPAVADRPKAEAGDRSIIMLVDDDEAIVDVVRRLLESAGHEVVGFADSREALARAGALPAIDLLLTDVVMPHVGGVDLAAGVRARHPDLPVVFMSGFNDGGDALRAATTSGKVLAKPFLPADLTEAVSLALVGS